MHNLKSRAPNAPDRRYLAEPSDTPARPRRDPEPSSLSAEEIRAIILEVLG